MTWCALCIVNLLCELNALLVSHTCVMILVPEIVSVVMFCLLVCLKRKQILEKSTMLYMIHEHNIYKLGYGFVTCGWLFSCYRVLKKTGSPIQCLYLFFYFFYSRSGRDIYIYIYIYICVKYCK